MSDDATMTVLILLGTSKEDGEPVAQLVLEGEAILTTSPEGMVTLAHEILDVIGGKRGGNA